MLKFTPYIQKVIFAFGGYIETSLAIICFLRLTYKEFFFPPSFALFYLR